MESHGGSDHIDYYDPLQTDRWLCAVSHSDFIRHRANGYMLISVGPDQYLGIDNRLYSEDLTTTTTLGYPQESVFTLGTEMHFYDPTNGTISTGNIYRFSSNLTQKDVLTILRSK